MACVASRMTNHHGDGHPVKLQTLSYASSVCRAAGFGGMGWEEGDLHSYLESELFLFGYLPLKPKYNMGLGQKYSPCFEVCLNHPDRGKN